MDGRNGAANQPSARGTRGRRADPRGISNEADAEAHQAPAKKGGTAPGAPPHNREFRETRGRDPGANTYSSNREQEFICHQNKYHGTASTDLTSLLRVGWVQSATISSLSLLRAGALVARPPPGLAAGESRAKQGATTHCCTRPHRRRRSQAPADASKPAATKLQTNAGAGSCTIFCCSRYIDCKRDLTSRVHMGGDHKEAMPLRSHALTPFPALPGADPSPYPKQVPPPRRKDNRRGLEEQPFLERSKIALVPAAAVGAARAGLPRESATSAC